MSNNALRFNTKDQNVWFVSDFHAKHGKDFILKPRGFTDGETAYEEMIRVWNERVQPNDIVFNLGDFVVGAGTESEQVAKELIRRLNGKQYYLWGNHSAGVKTIYKQLLSKQLGISEGLLGNTEMYPMTYDNKFTFLGHYAEIVVDSQFIVLQHYPLGSWNDMGKGSFQIFGHCHGNYTNGLPKTTFGKQLDVGWEVFGGPISFEDVKVIMAKKSIAHVDHHSKI